MPSEGGERVSGVTKPERREFLRKTLITSAYVAPTIATFSTKDVAKASPGGGFGTLGGRKGRGRGRRGGKGRGH